MRIIAFGAHPDDCEITLGGTAALWADLGHAVKFVSIANGDAGHHEQGGGALAARRRAEAAEAGRRLGIAEYQTLDYHDGEIMPTLDLRHEVVRQIRRWQADIVFLHRPSDYHPDHRYAGAVVQDAAYLVVVPNVCSDTPPLESNPIFLFMEDRFQRPVPFRPDIAVDIGPAWECKVDAIDAHVSQFYEWLPWVDRRLHEVPAGAAERRQWLARQWDIPPTPAVRETLARFYGRAAAQQVRHAEAFEICEYGRQPDEEQIRRLIPNLP